MGTDDLDLVVVGERAVFVCEEKAWGPHVITGEVSWYVKGAPRHNPVGQVNHVARMLAGRLKLKVPGWSQALRQLPKGCRPVSAHVVPSYDHLTLDDTADLGEHVVLRLADAAAVLTALDGRFPGAMAPLRHDLMTFLLGLPQRGPEQLPPQIMQYEVLASLPPQENSRVFSGRPGSWQIDSRPCARDQGSRIQTESWPIGQPAEAGGRFGATQ
jgi:hypothetical protein